MTVQYSKDVLHVDLILEDLLKDTEASAVNITRICQGYNDEQEVNQEDSIYGCDYGCAKRRRQAIEGYVSQNDLDSTYVIDREGTLRPGAEDPPGSEGTTDGGRTPQSSFTSNDGKFSEY